MSKGIFDLSGFESKQDTDPIGSTPLMEEAEFAPNSNATNNVDNGVKATNVSVPGGDKETPNAKPYDAHEVSVPGGISEKPKANAVPGVTVGIPSKTELTAEQYNQALNALKKSFNEGVKIIEVLEGVKIVEESVEQRQQNYTDEMIGNTILECYENGPIFEAVDSADKDAVKDIVKKLRGKISRDMHEYDVTFYKPNLVARIILGLVPGAGLVLGGAAAVDQIWSTRLWQVLGCVVTEGANVKDICDDLTKKYSEELGDFKVLYAQATPTIADLFRAKFNWKNQKNVYFVLVDRKLPAELKKFENEVKKAVKEGEKSGECKDGKCEDKK